MIMNAPVWLSPVLLFVCVLKLKNINGQTYTCSNYDSTGCTYLAYYYNDGDCDCTDCSDEPSLDCSTCSGGCPTVCDYYTSCSDVSSGTDGGSSSSNTVDVGDGNTACDDYDTSGCYYQSGYYNDNYCDCSDCSDEPNFSCNSCDGGCPSSCSSYTYCYQGTSSYNNDDTPCPSSTLEDGFQIGDIVDFASCAESFCEGDGVLGVVTKLINELGTGCSLIGGFLDVIDILNGNSDDVDPGVGIVATCWESSVIAGSRANFTSFANYLTNNHDLGATNEDTLTDTDEYTEYSVELTILDSDLDGDGDDAYDIVYYNDTSITGFNNTLESEEEEEEDESSNEVETFSSLTSNNQFISAIYDSTGTTKAKMISTAITGLMLDLTDKMEIASVVYNWTDDGFTRVLRSNKGVLYVDKEVGDKDFQFFICEANIVTNEAINIKYISNMVQLLLTIAVLCVFV